MIFFQRTKKIGDIYRYPKIAKDYDVALVRLSYPVADPDTGMSVLPTGVKFDVKTVMPICLPSSEDFEDTNRQAISVGMGIVAEKEKDKCFTDGNGPVVFQKCAPEWVSDPPRKNDYDLYETEVGCSYQPPPSATDELCRKYHEKIKALRL